MPELAVSSPLIPAAQYEQIMKTMPIFCVDWLIRKDNKYLLLRRKQQPMAGYYWHIGGRLRLGESIGEAANRIQSREIGRFCGMGRMIGFSNYMFENTEDARATHTPAITYLVDVDEFFLPKLDDTESGHIWTSSLPVEFVKQTHLINNEQLTYLDII